MAGTLSPANSATAAMVRAAMAGSDTSQSIWSISRTPNISNRAASASKVRSPVADASPNPSRPGSTHVCSGPATALTEERSRSGMRRLRIVEHDNARERLTAPSAFASNRRRSAHGRQTQVPREEDRRSGAQDSEGDRRQGRQGEEEGGKGRSGRGAQIPGAALPETAPDQAWRRSRPRSRTPV